MILFCGYLFVDVVLVDSLGFHCYLGWQEVKVDNICTLKVPGRWEVYEQDGMLHFCDPSIKDRDSNIVLVESHIGPMTNNGSNFKVNKNNIESNILGKKFMCILECNGTVNSVGSIYGETVISVDNNLHLGKYIYAENSFEEDVYFYTWNSCVDDELIQKIADSFVIE